MKHMVFGRSTEKKSRSKKGQEKQSKNTTRPPTSRKRGQQPGTPSHGRRKHDNLPVVDKEVDLPDDEKYCPTCRLPFDPFPGCDHCDVIEIWEGLVRFVQNPAIPMDNNIAGQTLRGPVVGRKTTTVAEVSGAWNWLLGFLLC